MNVRVRSRIGAGLLVFGLAAVPGCGRTSPVSPSVTAGSMPAVDLPSGISLANKPSGSDAGFPLVSGTFAIASDSGDRISGTYSGTSDPASRPERASLTMRIESGSGRYAGASGTLGGNGVGAFTGEGAFTLDLKGDAIVQGKHLPIRVGLSGTAAVSCAPSTRIAVTQTATGTMKKTGDVHATLVHEVERTGCQA
jgi:hypothetical protein